MRVSALWKREYAQARLFLFAVPIVHFLALGLQRMNKWLFTDPNMVARDVSHLRSMMDPVPAAYDFGSFESVGRLWLFLAIFVLALVQLGTERRNGSQELLFALPYARRTIFLHKWLLGAALLAGTLLLNTLIDAIVVLISPMSPYFSLVYHLTELGYSWLLLAAIYTLALFVGTIAGSVPSQIVLSIVPMVLPIVLGQLVAYSLRLHGIDLYPVPGQRTVAGGIPADVGNRLQEVLSLPRYLTLSYEDISWSQALGFAGLLVAAFVCGVLAYERNRTENNGKLVVLPAWERGILILFVLVLSMLAGLFSATMFDANERLGYDIGFVVAFIVITFVLTKLSKIRLRI